MSVSFECNWPVHRGDLLDGDEEIRRLLWLLEHGTESEKVHARNSIAKICEQRGLWDYAVECYEANFKAGVRTPGLYYRLVRAYWLSGRYVSVHPALVSMIGQFDFTAQARRLRAKSWNAGVLQDKLVRGGLIGLALVVSVMAASSLSGGSVPCTQIGQMFPQWYDPEGAVHTIVAQILRERGVNPALAPGNPFIGALVRAYAVPPDAAVAGWMAHRLYWEQKGKSQQTMNFAKYVEHQHRLRMSLGISFRPDYLGPMLSHEQWTEMQSWSASTCPGAILKNPENARLVRLMRQSIGDTTWLQR